MQINVGCFYFIKDSFFDIIDDLELMKINDHVTIVLKVKNIVILFGSFL